MLSTLFTAAAVTLAGLLPLPTDPATADGTQPAAAQVEVTGALDAPDGRLRRGCKDYRYAYSVTAVSDDWTFDITMQDRRGKGVNSQSLLGPNDDEAGVLTYRLCRWATVAGRFTLSGVLVSYDGDRETSVRVTETFRLRRTRS
ncbi:hypothetical protein CFI00_09130 [Nocardioides sp. S5]|uniref:hypothetical protein n=1 Tax=Nocardioides sp. S5 TaxID=2017486 RepID=UPI001A8C0930|nr:hypothetical protein [Nocardioides sp. S5]QSR30652.1 hypothetical protein CFI00_09130 [Nocardioides sp. S5]